MKEFVFAIKIEEAYNFFDKFVFVWQTLLFMKITASILMILVICSSVFYYGYFDVMLLCSKHMAMHGEAVAKRNSSFKILKVPLNQQDSYSDDEITLDGNLYDVAERKIIQDTLFLSLYHDTDEQDIVSAIADFFKSDDGYVSAFPHGSSVKNTRVFYNPQYCFDTLLFSFYVTNLKNNDALHNITLTTSTYCSIITPPPRIS